MAYTEEASKFNAQKEKLHSLCDEHDMVFDMDVDQYPIMLTISKATKKIEQPKLIDTEDHDDTEPKIDPNAKIVWVFKDTVLSMKVEGGTFTIGKELRTKIENIFLKICNFWHQHYFRQTQESNMLKKGKYPKIPENEMPPVGEDKSEETED